MKPSEFAFFLLTQATATSAWGGPYNSGDDSSSIPYSTDNDGNGSGSFGNENFSFGGYSLGTYHTKLVAHAVLATLAFGFFFPAGGILIRLASFPRLWIVHGLCQMIGFFMYILAFGLGAYLVRSSPQGQGIRYDPHPIIGLFLLALVFLQPFLGFIHHILYKKHLRRTLWSYAHLWIGRILITLGIINGGLGLRLASSYPLAPPSRGAIVGYGVAAGTMWLLYVLAALVSERRRRTVRESDSHALANRKSYTRSKSSSSRARVQYA